ncbi:MAG: type II toxin-antitoxin system HicA family toxin [Patescibacteria group bacterium]
MPSLSELPGEIKRRKFIRALQRLGFIIDKAGGAGSHYKATWPKTQKTITMQFNLRKDVLYYLLKEIESYSGITWDDIKEQL